MADWLDEMERRMESDPCLLRKTLGFTELCRVVKRLRAAEAALSAYSEWVDGISAKWRNSGALAQRG